MYDEDDDVSLFEGHPKFTDDIDLLKQLRSQLDAAIRSYDKIRALEQERNEWKEKYMTLLTDSIRHGEQMIGNVVRMSMQMKLKEN